MEFFFCPSLDTIVYDMIRLSCNEISFTVMIRNHFFFPKEIIRTKEKNAEKIILTSSE